MRKRTFFLQLLGCSTILLLIPFLAPGLLVIFGIIFLAIILSAVFFILSSPIFLFRSKREQPKDDNVIDAEVIESETIDPDEQKK